MRANFETALISDMKILTVPSVILTGNKRYCLYNNKTYSDYDQIDIYNVTDSNNYFCTSCTCRKGKFRDCLSQSCHLGLCSSDEAYFPPEACCPWCKPPSGVDGKYCILCYLTSYRFR